MFCTAAKLRFTYHFIFFPFQIRKDSLFALNHFQKLLGNVNWLRPHFKLTTGDLKTLFDSLKENANPNSPGQLTHEG